MELTGARECDELGWEECDDLQYMIIIFSSSAAAAKLVSLLLLQCLDIFNPLNRKASRFPPFGCMNESL